MMRARSAAAWLGRAIGRVTAREGRATVAVRVLFAVIALGSAVYLVEGGKPWDSKIVERLAEGRELRPGQFGQRFGWWAALACGVLSAGALATARWWTAPVGDGEAEFLGEAAGAGGRATSARERPSARGRGERAVFGVLLLVAVATAAWFRAPRLDQSLWNDEEYALRRYAWGQYEVQPDGTLEFDPVEWPTTLFFNRHANNHVWHSIEARVSLAGWEAIARPATPDFSERAVRFLPFVSGLAAVALTGVLGWVIGRPWLGIAAAVVLALSPWHVRYAVESRGYSTMLAFVLLALVSMIRGVETGRWRWWLTAAVSQAVHLLAFAGSLYVAAASNGMLFLVLAHRWWRNGRRPAVFGRWLVSGGLALILALPLTLPLVPQIAGYLDREDHQSSIEMDRAWFVDLWVHLIAGIPVRGRGDENPVWVDVAELSSRDPLVHPMVFGVLPVLAVAGAAGMFAGGWRSALVAAATLGAAGLSLAHNLAAGSKMYGWYLLYALPGLAFAILWWPTWAERRRGRAARVAAMAAGIAVVAATAWVTRIPRDRMMRFDRQPIAEVVETIRGTAHAHDRADDGGILTGTFGVSDRQVFSYDPRAAVVREPAELEALVAEARRSGKVLFVYFCGREATRDRHAETFAAVTGSGDFEKVGELAGLEWFFSYEIWKLKDGQARDAAAGATARQ